MIMLLMIGLLSDDDSQVSFHMSPDPVEQNNCMPHKRTEGYLSLIIMILLYMIFHDPV